MAPRIFEHRGTDGGNYVSGRKQYIVTDVEGRIFAYFVHAANGHDGTDIVLGLMLGLRHELASRPPTVRGFVPVAKRWVVERTLPG